MAVGILSAASKSPAEKAIIKLTDGSTVEGFSRTYLGATTKSFEISQTETGPTTSYDIDRIDRISVYSSDINRQTHFVVKQVYTTRNGDKTAKAFVREDYKGNGIGLYSLTSERMDPRGNRAVKVSFRIYYIQLGDDIAQMATMDPTGTLNPGVPNRRMCAKVFENKYPEFAERIQNKEFDMKASPIQAVKAWETTYAGK